MAGLPVPPSASAAGGVAGGRWDQEPLLPGGPRHTGAEHGRASTRGPQTPPRRQASDPGLGPTPPGDLGGLNATGCDVWGPQGSAQLQRGRGKPPGPTPADLGHQRTHLGGGAGAGTSTVLLGTAAPVGAAGTAQPHPGPSGRPPAVTPGHACATQGSPLGPPGSVLGPCAQWWCLR